MEVLEFSADHFEYWTDENGAIQCFSKNPKIQNSEKKSVVRKQMEVLELSADHFEYWTDENGAIQCFF